MMKHVVTAKEVIKHTYHPGSKAYKGRLACKLQLKFAIKTHDSES